MAMSELRRAKEEHKEELLAKENVVGVGLAEKRINGQPTGTMTVVALVRKKIPRAGLDPKEIVPSHVDGIPTDVIEVGDLKAHAARTDRWRPAPGGVSIGHYRITAGTLGCLVRDRETGARLILSNNHVLANGNDASIEDPILQPGTADGGREENDTIAYLERFVPIEYSLEPSTCGLASGLADVANLIARLVGSKHRLQAIRANPEAVNRVDAALARPTDDSIVSDEILEIGRVAGTLAPSLGLAVRKSGRTTGLTTGEITVIEATVDVGYDERLARFEGQMLTGPMSEPGDSGSLLVAANSLQAVGLLFAGSTQTTIYNPIANVLSALAVTL
ncbi:MAG TPA: hypothetical protein VFI11_09355 [Anaerolineales bacterium]|nr:hypothetical protein [Anaerolineales bacterium]